VEDVGPKETAYTHYLNIPIGDCGLLGSHPAAGDSGRAACWVCEGCWCSGALVDTRPCTDGRGPLPQLQNTKRGRRIYGSHVL
jgi:hypothetical protein